MSAAATCTLCCGRYLYAVCGMLAMTCYTSLISVGNGGLPHLLLVLLLLLLLVLLVRLPVQPKS
jgi:hypothetical protein